MTSKPETEMVERCARAICNRRLPKPAYDADAFDNLKTWCEPGLERWEESQADLDGFYADARAVLEALRDPTPEMEYVGGTKCENMMFGGDEEYTGVIFKDMGVVFRTMIDAALSPTKQEEEGR